jgi:hypothetical protein
MPTCRLKPIAVFLLFSGLAILCVSHTFLFAAHHCSDQWTRRQGSNSFHYTSFSVCSPIQQIDGSLILDAEFVPGQQQQQQQSTSEGPTVKSAFAALIHDDEEEEEEEEDR